MKRAEGRYLHEGEWLAVQKIDDESEFEGMFEVIDSEGFQIAVAFTRRLAVRAAAEELEYLGWQVDRWLAHILEESE